MSGKQKRRCQAQIYKRDCLRYTGRGRHGFEMHYTKCQCSIVANFGDWCYQHKNGTFLKCSWADEFMSEPAPTHPTP